MLRDKGRRHESGNTLPTPSTHGTPIERMQSDQRGRASCKAKAKEGRQPKTSGSGFDLLSLLRFTGVRAETPHWH